jgi:nucleoside-diphosphate-sugar epimerase
VRWVITGAQGFIGRYTTARVLASRPDARVLGIGRSARSENCFSHHVTGPNGPVPAPVPANLLKELGSRFQYYSLHTQDVEGMTSLLGSFQPDIILHLASSLRGDSKNDLLATNVDATESLFASIVLSGCKAPKVVVASTGGVYGEVDPRRLPSREFDDCAPTDDYSVSKLLAEKSARHAANGKGIPLAVARIFNVVGAGQSERHVAGKIVAQLMSVARGSTRRISLGLLGHTRDFIDVRDVARALVIIAEKGQGTFNVSTGSEVRVADLLNTFLASSQISAEVYSELCDGGVIRSCGDLTRLRELGFEKEHSLRDSVVATLEYYVQLWKI